MIARMQKMGGKAYLDIPPLVNRFDGSLLQWAPARFALASPMLVSHPHVSSIMLAQGWVSGRLGKIAHERRVLVIASTIFDLTQSLHRLSNRARRLLCAAALVHDVGRSVSRANHPRQGWRMIMNDPGFPALGICRRYLAYLTLYHRDDVPPLGKDEVLLPGDDKEGMLILLAILRAADALDSRSKESPRLALSMDRRTLKVNCYLRDDSAKVERLYRRRKKFRLLEELLDCAIDVRVKCSA